MHTPNDTFNTQGKLKKQTYLIIQCVTVCYTSNDAPTRTCFKPPPLSCRSLSFHWLPIYLDFLDLGAISISIIFHFKNTTDDLHFLRWPAAPEPEITPPPRPHPPRSLVPPLPSTITLLFSPSLPLPRPPPSFGFSFKKRDDGRARRGAGAGAAQRERTRWGDFMRGLMRPRRTRATVQPAACEAAQTGLPVKFSHAGWEARRIQTPRQDEVRRCSQEVATGERSV